MAEEEKKDTSGDKGPQPAVDADQIRQIVADSLANWEPPQPREPERRPEPQPAQVDPVTTLIADRVNPALAKLGFAAADAKDAALFYIENPEMVAHKKDIEEAFGRLMAQGTPMTRQAVGEWYKGKNFDKFHKKANEDAEAAAKRAQDASDTGPGGARRREAPAKDPHTMTDEDLAKSLEGVAF